MDFSSLITGVVGSLATITVAVVAKLFDFKKAQRKAQMEEDKNDNNIQLEKMKATNDEWERIYHDQVAANRELKKDYSQLREEMYSLQSQVSKLNQRIADLTTGFTDKEKNYLLQIEALQEENDDLVEANAELKERLETLKGGG